MAQRIDEKERRAVERRRKTQQRPVQPATPRNKEDRKR